MRQPRLFSALLVSVFVLGLTLFAPAVEAAPLLSVNPDTTTVGAGGTFSLHIDITDAVDLAFFQFSLVFDPAIVAVNALTDGGFFGLGSFFVPGTIDNTAGVVSFIASVSPGLTGVSGDGTLADVQLTGVAAGISSVSLLFDPDPFTGDGLYDSSFGLIGGFATNAASVTVTDSTAPVPEPASLLLLGSGLAGAWFRHRRKSRGAIA